MGLARWVAYIVKEVTNTFITATDATPRMSHYTKQTTATKCYKEQYTEKICDDMDEEHCNLCNSDAEYLYLVEGKWICEQCLKSIADRVDMEV